MHARHRLGPGNGYRSNGMVMRGVAAASSRISPEGMGRGHNRFYNSEHRNYGRGGYGRSGGGGSRQFQPPNRPPDIFVEAGKLAAEYLVSKGLLPPHALSGKWHNNGFEGSAQTRSDVGPGRRKYSDEYNSLGLRARRELGRSGSSDEKSRSPPGMEPVANGEITPESNSGNSLEDSGAKASPSNGKIQKSDADADGETIKGSDDANKFHEEMGKEEMNDNQLEQNLEQNKEATFENIPTEEAHREHDAVYEDENNTARNLSEGSEAVTVGVHQNQELKSPESDVLQAPAAEKELDVVYSIMPEQCSGSESFPERTVMERGEKRAMDDDIDSRDSFKKLREWVPSVSMENQPTLHEQITSQSSSHGTPSSEQKTVDLPYDFMQEKQLFPGSFRTCDLNLGGNCDINENRDAGTHEEARPIDIDLSTNNVNNNNSFNLPKRNGQHGINDTDIEVIDLESDSAREDDAFGNPESRGDIVSSDLDGFRNNVHNANEIPDVQDGYGLMISELLGNSSPNCSSVPTELNSLNDDVGLPSGEGILGDDDSIYMSLDEIPISFLRSWE